MTATVLESLPVEFNRDYSHDFESKDINQDSLIKRVAIAAIPFFSYHKHLKLPVALLSSGYRAWRAFEKKEMIGTVISIVAIAGAFFNNKIFLGITTSHDIYLNAIEFLDKKEQRTLIAIKILKDICYLSLLAFGCGELMILSNLLQTIAQGYESSKEFKKGRWIEGVSLAARALIDGKKTVDKIKVYQRELQIKQKLKSKPIPKLGQKWQFPSDHLPIGVKVNGVRIFSWNVLNQNLLKWVTHNDSQGLNGSMITELNQLSTNDPTITQREELIAQMILHASSEAEIIALQECRPEFLTHLKTQLPPSFVILDAYSEKVKNLEALVYNNSKLQQNVDHDKVEKYPCRQDKNLVGHEFTSKNQDRLRVVNLHIPGDPKLSGKEEAARFVASYASGFNGAVVAIGDHNFERDQMVRAYVSEGLEDFSLHSLHNTNIDPYSKSSKCIDHALVLGAKESLDMDVGAVFDQYKFKETAAHLTL